MALKTLVMATRANVEIDGYMINRLILVFVWARVYLRNPRSDLRTYGVYSIIKQKAFEGDISGASICMNLQ